MAHHSTASLGPVVERGQRIAFRVLLPKALEMLDVIVLLQRENITMFWLYGRLSWLSSSHGPPWSRSRCHGESWEATLF